MYKSTIIFLLLTIIAATSSAETVRGSSSPGVADHRELTTCGAGKQCYLYDIQKGQRIKTLGDPNDKRYALSPVDTYHKGYSIECDFGPQEVDYLKWYFPDGKNNYRTENSHPWWLNGDQNGQPYFVEWLSQSGYKYVKVEAYKYGSVCYSKTFEFEAYCPKGYYDWYGHCYKWVF